MFHAVALVIGTVALVVLLDRLGWAGLRDVLVGAGWWFAVIAAIDLVALLFDTAAICAFIRPRAPARYWRVFVAQASGVAINRLTPGNSAGEPVKVTMLLEHVPGSAAVAGIVMFNLATIGVAIAAIAVGVPITLLLLELPARLQIFVWSTTAGLVLVALLLLALARRGALGTLVDGARRIRLLSPSRAEAWRHRVADVDAQVREFGRPGARLGIAYVFGSRVLNWAGTVAVMIAAGVPLTAPLVIANLSVGILITWISNVIPLGLGLADGTNYALYGVLGATGSHGLVFTMINRARTCVLAGMGLVVMLVANLAARRTRA